MKYVYTFLFAIISLLASAQKNTSVSFEQWLSLRQVGAPKISDDGRSTAFTITSTDWQNNSYDSEIWVSNSGGTPFQLTRTAKGSSSNPQFTPDGKWISFLADRGNKIQIYLISVTGGEALQITKEEEGISDYAWSRDGKMIAFTKDDPDNASEKGTKSRYGAFDIEDETFKYSHLWLLNFNIDSLVNALQSPCFHGKADSTHTVLNGCYLLPRATRLTHGNFNVSSISWNPDGRSIAVTQQPDPRIKSSSQSDIDIVDVARQFHKIIANPGADKFGAWSPDGKAFVYSSYLADTTSNFYKNDHLFIYDMANHSSREIAADLDEDKVVTDWNEKGIFLSAAEKMKSSLFEVNPQSGKVARFKTEMDVISGAAFSKDGRQLAMVARNFSGLAEVYRINEKGNTKKITSLNAQLNGWNTPVNEIVSWKSKDGAIIEGVLLKPRNYDPSKKYPLLVVIHGGPTGVDRPEPAPTYVYPIMQWCEKGALVLRVNYRGSAGYGEKFRSLNVNNLGVGDMWDVMSGVDNLAKKGLIDTSRMGCMGWSQGGYISAFLTTNTHSFKAISVGAGISDWMTYYVSTDITPFAPQYLGSTPWSNPALYQKTSPITNINQATTPTLIQHGELDKRVPISDAFELYRGLQDRKVPSKLIIYKGFGHGITRPKERLAAIWHNWQWFNHYIFGEQEEKMPTE
jgi:dipeptidyl aminopeptidase/acylaminoacyl peptidase